MPMYLDRIFSLFTLLTIYYFGLAAPAHAYFDLGTGTYLLQMILGFGAAMWLALRTSMIKIDRKLKAKTTPAPQDIEGPDQDLEKAKSES